MVLASDPVVPPRFVVVSRKAAEPGVLRGWLDFKDGYDQQYFDALITCADGSVEKMQFGIEGLAWEFAAALPPRSVRVVNEIYGLAGEPLPLDVRADFDITWHFEPNGLGKADLSTTPLRLEGDVLVARPCRPHAAVQADADGAVEHLQSVAAARRFMAHTAASATTRSASASSAVTGPISAGSSELPAA